MKRREFIHQLGLGTAASLIPTTLVSFAPSVFSESSSKKLKFGIATDIHKDLMPDADERLEKFILEAQNKEVDFIIQLGDFCMADSKNKAFLHKWEQFKGPKYHVLGNHDMDRHSKEEMLDFWGMPKTYYSFDEHGIHFIVLDANFLYEKGIFTDYNKANFYVDSSLRTFINDEQIEWLQADLESTKLPTVVFSHQSLWHYEWGVNNRSKVQRVLENHGEKIICCLNGHNHIDYHHKQNGIDYIDINSMSYQWMNDKYKNTDRYPIEKYQEYRWLANIAPYKKPLYAFSTIDLNGSMTIEGVRSAWIPPSPYDLGMPKAKKGSIISAEISDYSISF